MSHDFHIQHLCTFHDITGLNSWNFVIPQISLCINIIRRVTAHRGERREAKTKLVGISQLLQTEFNFRHTREMEGKTKNWISQKENHSLD